MRIASLSLVSLVLIVATVLAKAATPAGEWITPDKAAKIRIAPCGDSLCGTVVWLKNRNDPATGRPQMDVRNPDPALRGRPVVGLRLLTGFKSAGASRWAGGRIYDPKSGKTYDSKLSLAPDGVLKVQGCVGVFCVTQAWTPAG